MTHILVCKSGSTTDGEVITIDAIVNGAHSRDGAAVIDPMEPGEANQQRPHDDLAIGSSKARTTCQVVVARIGAGQAQAREGVGDAAAGIAAAKGAQTVNVHHIAALER